MPKAGSSRRPTMAAAASFRTRDRMTLRDWRVESGKGFLPARESVREGKRNADRSSPPHVTTAPPPTIPRVPSDTNSYSTNPDQYEPSVEPDGNPEAESTTIRFGNPGPSC